MEYFCAQCQQKHNITDIAVDMYGIIKKDVSEQLKILATMGDNQEYRNRFYRIAIFFNDPDNTGFIRKHVLFSRGMLEKQLKNAAWRGTTISGTLVLDMEWLLGIYENSGMALRDNASAAESVPPEKLMDVNAFPQKIKKHVLFAKSMQFVFSKVSGSNNELVFNYVAPPTNGGENAYTEMSYLRACPYCGKNVSQAVGKAPETVIALAGSPRAGKTSCITAIASALCSNRYRQYGMSMDVNPNDDQWAKLSEEIKNYDQGYIVTKTPKEIYEVPAYSYLVRIGEDNGKPVERVFTFVDMPGEFWQDDKGLSKDFYEKYAGLYENIDCVWFFISKLAVHNFDLGGDANKPTYQDKHQDVSLRRNQVRLQRETAESTETIKGSGATNIGSNLRSLREHLEAHGKEMPPFAVIITKTEVAYDPNNPKEVGLMEKYMLFPSYGGRMINTNLEGINKDEIRKVMAYDRANDRYVLSESRFFARNVLVRQYLSDVNDSIRSVIEQNCAKRFYIAMAAYGHPAAASAQSGPDRNTDGIVATPPTPFHEMYPLLWTLAVTEGLYIQHDCSWFTPTALGKLLKNNEGSYQRGAVETLFNHAVRPVPAKKRASEEEIDRMKLHDDIAANLLMQSRQEDKRLYTATEFDHPRR